MMLMPSNSTRKQSRVDVSLLAVFRGRRVTRWVAAVTLAAFGQLSLDLASPQMSVAQPSESVVKQRRVALFVLPRSKASTGDALVLQSLMREELSKLDDVVAVGATSDPVQSASATIEPLVEEGFRALADRDGGKAEPLFRKAYDALSTYRGPFNRRLAARTLKGYGVAAAMINQREVAADMMSGALNLWSDQTSEEYGWTLDTRAAFRDLERTRENAPAGSIEINSEPDGAPLWLDGKLVGFAPLELQELGPGKHWIEGSIDGYRRSGSFVEITAGESAIHYVDLEAIPNRRAYVVAARDAVKQIRGRSVVGPMSKMQKAAVADAIIVLTVTKARGAYQFNGWFRDGAGQAERLRVNIAEDGAFLGNVRNFLAGTLNAAAGTGEDILALDGPPQATMMGDGEVYIDPNDPIFRNAKEEEEDPITGKWWFWAIVGGVAAGLVVGGVVLFSGNDDGSGPAGAIKVNLNSL